MLAERARQGLKRLGIELPAWLAGVGLDVVPVEPPVEPVPALLRAYRARETWTLGRLIVTPHSAFYSPQAWDDIRSKSAETMRAALLGPRPQNVILPESD